MKSKIIKKLEQKEKESELRQKAFDQKLSIGYYDREWKQDYKKYLKHVKGLILSFEEWKRADHPKFELSNFIEHFGGATLFFYEDGSHGIDENIEEFKIRIKKLLPKSKIKVWSEDDTTYVKIIN